MRAIIMAGGEGKRLRPLTCTMPKPMAPLLGRPVIDYCVELLKKHNLTDITATLHYLPQAIREHLGDGEDFGVQMRYSMETVPMGTAGSVRAALGEKLERTLVISGDALTDVDISGALRFHEANHALVTLVLTRVDAPTEFGVVLLEENGRVQRFFEKPMPAEVYSNLANTGIYILESEALEKIPKNAVFDFSNDLFPMLLREGAPMYGFVSSQYWCDIGSIESYIDAQIDLLDGKCLLFSLPDNGIVIEEDAAVSPGAVIVPPCYICRDAQIASGARIGPYAVIGRGSRIGEHSSVKHALLLDNVRLRENVEARGCVLCEDSHLEDRCLVFDGAVVGEKAWLEEGVQVKPGVRIWPGRRVEAGYVCQSDVIWERGEHGETLSGFADMDLTPAYAMKVGAAFARTMENKTPELFALADDGTQVGVMLKTAACAGLLSQGADVCDLGFISHGAFFFSIRQLGCRGGIYAAGEEKYRASILAYDMYGTRVESILLRKLTQNLREELRPVTDRSLGLLSQTDIQHSYDAHLRRSIKTEQLKGVIALAAPEGMFDTVARVMSGYGVRVLYSRSERGEDLLADKFCGGAVIAFLVHEDEIEDCYYSERALDSCTRQCILMLHAIEMGEERRFFLPADMPEEYASLLESKGAAVLRASRDADVRMRLSIRENCFYPALFETETMIVHLSVLAVSGEMERLLRLIPSVSEKRENIPCSWKDLGRVMRGIVETEHLSGAELMEGVRVKNEKGWVLVHPEGVRNCRVVAQSMRSEYAGDLCELYVRKVENIMKKE